MTPRENIKESTLIEPIRPDKFYYKFERYEMLKIVTVEGKTGLVSEWIEKIDGREYNDYTEEEYPKHHWRDIEYQYKRYQESLLKYQKEMEEYRRRKKNGKKA